MRTWRGPKLEDPESVTVSGVLPKVVDTVAYEPDCRNHLKSGTVDPVQNGVLKKFCVYLGSHREPRCQMATGHIVIVSLSVAAGMALAGVQ